MADRRALPPIRRVVVKLGTRVLVDGDGRLDEPNLDRILGELADLREAGLRPVVVTSGAIGLGFRALGHEKRPTALPDLQAAAAVGQSRLMQAYESTLARRGLGAAQLLLTHADVQDRRRYLNIRNTFLALERGPLLPVVNENDTVAVEEIQFGDNDVLSAMVVDLLAADALVLLSSVEGLLRDGAVVPAVERITSDVLALAGPGDGLGRGGMTSKLEAARVATTAGACAFIAHGKRASLRALLAGEPIGTYFPPARDTRDRRQRWLAHAARAEGTLVVDDGAARALRRDGKSLLPAGVVEVRGEFDVGDPVAISGPDGRPFAKGLANYAARDVRRIQGRKTSEIAALLGAKDFYDDEVVHRDNLVLLEDA